MAARAAQLRAQHPALKSPDAFVIATGLVHGADLVVTADRGWPDHLGIAQRMVGPDQTAR